MGDKMWENYLNGRKFEKMGATKWINDMDEKMDYKMDENSILLKPEHAVLRLK